MKYLLIFGLLLQSCAVTKTETKIVRGKELSKTSLGRREVENNKYLMKEITPYSVSISRKACEAELFRTEHKGVRETVHERRELSCAEAYPDYIAFQLTTFGIPFLYDLVTGFGIFREKCVKGPPKTSKDTVETNTTVTQEILDLANTICRDVPISGAEVTAVIDTKVSKLVSSTEGVASLTPDQMISIESLERDVSVDYHYMSETKKTTIKRVARPAKQVAMTYDLNTEKDITITGVASSGDKPEVKSDDLVGKANINVGAAKQNIPVKLQKMFKVNDQSPAVKNGTELTGVTAENKDVQGNKTTGKANEFLVVETQRASTEMPKIDKVKSQDSSVKNNEKTTALKQEQQEVKTVVVTPASFGLNKNELPSRPIPLGSEDKPVQVLFKIEYAYNKADVSKESLEVLKLLADTMRNNPNMVSAIEGHTDNLGSPEVNRKMSFRRASAIKNVFVNRYGIAASRIQVYGYGLTRPIADNKLAEGRAKNRRTEIYTAESAAGP